MVRIRRYEVIYASYRYKEPHKAHYMGRCAFKNVARNFLKLKDYPCYVISVKEE